MIKYIKSIPRGLYVIAAILLVAVMMSACTIEDETCYSATETMNDPFTGEIVPLIIDCEDEIKENIYE